MSLGDIERNSKRLDTVTRELQETTNRINNKKNMNGYHWDGRIKLVEEKKRLEQNIINDFTNL